MSFAEVIGLVMPHTAKPMGIKKISKGQQVLCITHQPTLAAAGLAHFKVNKNVI